MFYQENLKDGEGDGEEDRSDNEDEKPQIVVLKAGDLTAEEVHDIKHVPADDRTSSDSIESGKIKFKKPMKRSSDDDSCSNDLKISSSKKKKEELLRAADETSKKHSRKAVKNSSLLSFGDDDEEEETEDD
ncbi:uncharacterized protein KIAA1143 homolog [Tubulanus polymorphus]|uniref:uncharacterized protein KIAA1143 homolog n=1 Tax=Tubulanus polymorphus TaxID=672921 RepID=UPI003DA25BB0